MTLRPLARSPDRSQRDHTPAQADAVVDTEGVPLAAGSDSMPVVCVDAYRCCIACSNHRAKRSEVADPR